MNAEDLVAEVTALVEIGDDRAYLRRRAELIEMVGERAYQMAVTERNRRHRANILALMGG